MRGGRHGAGHHHRAGLAAIFPGGAIDDTDKLRRDIALKLTVVARQLRKQFDHALEQLGVTRSQWTVIAVVAQQPGISQRAIAEVLEVSEAGAGRLIDRLCADGLLARHAREADRRAYRIELTGAARPILEKIGGIALTHEARVFAGIADADLLRLGTLLDEVYRNINPQAAS